MCTATINARDPVNTLWQIQNSSVEEVIISSLFLTKITVVLLFILVVLVSTSHQHPVPRSTPAVPYEMVYATNSTTEVTGVITMWCHDGLTAEEVLLSDVKFCLNRTSARDPGL